MKNITKQESRYRHLGIEEREEISIGIEGKESLSAIAAGLGRHKSTISREIKRNSPEIRKVRYRANRAQVRSDERSRESHRRERLKVHDIQKYVVEKLRLNWTPEIIAGRLPVDMPGFTTNYESIYQWIYTERRDLIKYLPRSHRRRRKRGTAKNKRAIRIPNRILIEKRPPEVEGRETFGHWEADTAVSRQSKAAIAVTQERKSRYCRIRKLKSKTSSNMRDGLIAAIGTFPKHLVKTITYDNGTENAEHEATNEVLGTQSFFCRPYHSWEKGSVENCIGLIRRDYPKKTDWGLLTQKHLNRLEHRLNTRPKKCLGFKTPEEIFVALTG